MDEPESLAELRPTRTDRHLTSGLEWGWRDLLTTLMISFVAMCLMFIIATVSPATMSAGDLVVQITWTSCDPEKTVDADVDLWVKAPGDGPVGYSRRTGLTFDLLHDHRGFHVEGDYSNTEFAVARNLPSGKYIINAVIFTSWDNQYPVCLKTILSQAPAAGKGNKEIFTHLSRLTAHNKEETIVVFYVDQNKSVDMDSIKFDPPPTLLWSSP